VNTEQDAAIPEVDFDHTDPAYARNPYDRFSELREKCPVAHSPKFGGFWVLSRYEDIVRVSRDTNTFSNAPGISWPPIGSLLPLVPIESDPPLHSAYRRVLQQEFRRGRMRDLEDGIRQLTNELIDTFIDRGEADLMAELVTPLPATSIARLLGFAATDWRLLRDWLTIMIEAARVGDVERGTEAATTFVGHLAAALDERRTSPRDDMLTRIVQSEVDGHTLSELDALGMTWLTFVAGHETTLGGLGGLLMHVGSNPSLKRRLLADPSLIPNAIEETLRLEAPIQGMLRSVTQDVCIRDQWLREGDKIWLAYGSGNRDEEHFTDPAHFDLDRSQNRHLSFGDGIHRCVGAPLAQLEMQVALEEVLRRMPDYTVEDPAGLDFVSHQSRMLAHLPARWS
jgi:cytochrome P450